MRVSQLIVKLLIKKFWIAIVYSKIVYIFASLLKTTATL